MTMLVQKIYPRDDWDIISKSYKRFDEDHQHEVSNLMQWLKKQPHLPLLNRASVGFFLRLSNMSTETAKEAMDTYFSHKTRNPEMFSNRLDKPFLVEQTFNLIEVMVPDPWDLSFKGKRLSIARLIDTDANKLDFHKAMQLFTAVMDFELARVALSIKGVIGVIDMNGFHLGYLPKVNLTDVAVILKYVQNIENYIAEVHVINCNPLISQVMALVRPFLSKNLAAKLHFFTPNQMEDFYEFVPKSCLPSTYGGVLEPMQYHNAIFRERFLAAADYLEFADSENYKVKDELRQNKKKRDDMKGSFRKLCID